MVLHFIHASLQWLDLACIKQQRPENISSNHEVLYNSLSNDADAIMFIAAEQRRWKMIRACSISCFLGALKHAPQLPCFQDFSLYMKRDDKWFSFFSFQCNYL